MWKQEARAGRLDPVIGRDEEIRRTIQILSRRTKNNPVPPDAPSTPRNPKPETRVMASQAMGL